MALIKCPECGKEISDKAASCPHCGCPISHPQTQAEKTVIQNNLQNAKPKKKGHGCLITLLCIIAVPVFIGIVANLITGELIIKETPSQNTESDYSASTLTKEEAKDIDKQIWDYVYPVILAHNDLMNAMTSYSDGSLSDLDLYDAADNFYSYTRSVWGNPPDITDKNGKEYLDSCRDYILIEQSMADSLKKYIDSKKTSDLSKVEENINRCTEAVQIVASNRGTFLGINNFSDEEIQQILDETFQQ